MSTANPTPLYLKIAVFEAIIKHDREAQKVLEAGEQSMKNYHECNRVKFPPLAFQVIEDAIADACKQWDEDMKKGEQQ